MADVLSQSEVESLLASLDPGKSRTAAAPVAKERRIEDPSIQISVYDFKRPERVSKEQMRAFHALHDSFSREFGAALSGMLRTIIEVKLISVDQLTYSEFVFSLENPTCFNLLKSETLQDHFILDLNPSILFPILDRLLGGGKNQGHSFPRRPLTEIEMRLASRIVGLAIDVLHKSWLNVCDLKLHVSQVESNPQLVQIVPPNEVIVLISFEINFGELRGILNLCIPYNTIEPVALKLSMNTWSTYSQKHIDPYQSASLETGIANAKVNLVVQMAKTKLTVSELVGLAIGDVILTEKDKQSGMAVKVEGVEKYYAQPGVYKGHKAIQISKLLPRDDEVVQAWMEGNSPKSKPKP